MLKIKKDTSLRLSLVLAVAALVTIVGIMIALPFFVGRFGGYYAERYCEVLVLLYMAALPVAAADILLIRLLRLVKVSRVFTAEAVGSLRGISWCCFAEFFVLLVPGTLLLLYFDWLAIMLGFAAAFLGIVLRVVKNVIEEATAIKSENDYTI